MSRKMISFVSSGYYYYYKNIIYVEIFILIYIKLNIKFINIKLFPAKINNIKNLEKWIYHQLHTSLKKS
jgi:hypothetical protein